MPRGLSRLCTILPESFKGREDRAVLHAEDRPERGTGFAPSEEMEKKTARQGFDPGLATLDPGSSPARRTFYLRVGKRLLDVCASSVGLVLSSPLLLLCSILIRLESPGPVFYRQWRVGQGGKPFQILKLRSMVVGADCAGKKITATGDARITRVGLWLRRMKIDEIPQLWNVLRGEMSLVGPRPEVPEYVAMYDDEQRRVFEFKPGITGPASLAFVDEERLLAGRLDQEGYYVKTVLARKLELDLAHCRKATFGSDLKLIFGTLMRLIKGHPTVGGGSQA